MDQQEPTYTIRQLEGFAQASRLRPEDEVQMYDVIDGLGLESDPYRRVTQAELEAAARDLPIIRIIRGFVERLGRPPHSNTDFLLQTGGFDSAA